jgi:DNA-binding MarR family transcriptional regulator
MLGAVDARSRSSVAELQRGIVAFVRAYGLHKPDETPCGVAVSVSEAHALTTLAEAGDTGLSQTELGRRLRLAKSTVSRLVDRMDERGWVTRQPGHADGRLRTVALTARGRRMAGQVSDARLARLTRLLDRIPAGERAAVLAALDTLVEAARES